MVLVTVLITVVWLMITCVNIVRISKPPSKKWQKWPHLSDKIFVLLKNLRLLLLKSLQTWTVRHCHCYHKFSFSFRNTHAHPLSLSLFNFINSWKQYCKILLFHFFFKRFDFLKWIWTFDWLIEVLGRRHIRHWHILAFLFSGIQRNRSTRNRCPHWSNGSRWNGSQTQILFSY